MKSIGLFFMLLFLQSIGGFSLSEDVIALSDNNSWMEQNAEYYCPYCNVKLKPESKIILVDTDEYCNICGGDGLVDDVDRAGNIIKNSKDCPVCEDGKKQKIVWINYLYCPNCKGEFSYPE